MSFFHSLLSAGSNTALLISGYDLDILNRFVLINFYLGVYHSSTGGVLSTDLAVTNFSANGGTNLTITISSITQVDGSALAGGETTIKVNLSISGGNATGVETFEIQPSASGAYRDVDNNFCSPDDSTGAITVEKELDPMYKAVILAELTASEDTPTRPQRLVENAWFVSARSAGWLTELDLIHLASFDQNHLRYNFVTGTKDATIVGSPVLTQYLGQIGAVGGYIDFNWDPSTNGTKFLQNDCSLMICVTNNAQSNNLLVGTRGDGGASVNIGHLRITPRTASNQAASAMGHNNSGYEVIVTSQTDSIGVWMASRNAASGASATALYKDGTQIGTNTSASSSRSNQDLFGNTENPNGGAVTVNTTHSVLIWTGGSNLRSSASSISTVTNTLRTDLAALIPNIVADKFYAWLGQSNMDVAESIADLSVSDYNTYVANGSYLMANGYQGNCYVWWDDEWQPLEPGVNGITSLQGGPNFSPLYAFAYAEMAKYPGEDLYFIHQAVGGTGMKTSAGNNNWLPGGVPSTQFATFKREYDASIAALTSVTTYMAANWGQGEYDAKTLSDANDYQANEVTWANGILAQTSFTKFVVMQIHTGLKASVYPYKATVRAAKVTNDTGISNYTLVSIDDLTLQSDETHLTNSSSITFAQRMSAANP